jgi:hypothetical protein
VLFFFFALRVGKSDMVCIEYPDYDIVGAPRPPRMPRLGLATQVLRRILKTIARRRKREPEIAAALDEMEQDLWRKAHAARRQRLAAAPSAAGWRALLADLPRREHQPRASRADRRRRALALQGLAKSWGTDRPLSVASAEAQRAITFGRRRWQSPLPRCGADDGDALCWHFSPYRLDYYANVQVPSDPRAWLPAPLYKRLVQRGRARRSPQAVPRRRR